MSRRVVLWSGGADSTLTLDWWAQASSRGYPVVALSVVAHPSLGSSHLKMQNEAQKRYLEHAKKRGYHIEHQRVNVRGNFDVFEGKQRAQGQAMLWLSVLIPCLNDGDTVLLSYIKKDSFWHNRHLFEDTFNAACRLKGIDVELKYPYEWYGKEDIVRELRKFRIPDNCWWTCDEPVDNKACGKCQKCKDVKNAKDILRAKRKEEKNSILVEKGK